jgi:hypothetical protein
MREDRASILLRALAAGVVVWAASLGCGGGTNGPASHDGGRDGDSAIAMDAAADAPITPDAAADAPPLDAAVDVPPDAPPDVREQLLDAAEPCTEGGTCAGSGMCCGGVCVDVSKDPRHCGACDRTCSVTQFCTGSACNETVFANVCGNPNGTVIKDMYDADNNAATAVGTALMMSCTPPTMVVTRDQGEPGVLSAGGRPLAGSGTTYLIGGGNFGQRAVDYLDKTDMTPVFLTGDSTNIQLHNRGTGAVVLSAAISTLTDAHDYFYVQMFVEPLSGTLCVSAVGMYPQGTVAGGFWLSAEIIPKRAMYTDTWYAYEWTDSGDKIPNAADTFRLVTSGH